MPQSSLVSQPLIRLLYFHTHILAMPFTEFASIVQRHCWAALLDNCEVYLLSSSSACENHSISSGSATTSTDHHHNKKWSSLGDKEWIPTFLAAAQSSIWRKKNVSSRDLERYTSELQELHEHAVNQFPDLATIESASTILPLRKNNNNSTPGNSQQQQPPPPSDSVIYQSMERLCQWYSELFEQLTLPLVTLLHEVLIANHASSSSGKEDTSALLLSSTVLSAMAQQYLIDGIDQWMSLQPDQNKQYFLHACGVFPSFVRGSPLDPQPGDGMTSAAFTDLTVDFLLELLYPSQGFVQEGTARALTAGTDNELASSSSSRAKRGSEAKGKQNNKNVKSMNNNNTDRAGEGETSGGSGPIEAGSSRDWLWLHLRSKFGHHKTNVILPLVEDLPHHQNLTSAERPQGVVRNGGAARKRDRAESEPVEITPSPPPSKPNNHKRDKPTLDSAPPQTDSVDDVQEEEEEEDDLMIVTKDNVSLMLHTKPHLLPKSVLHSLRKSLLDPTITAYELEHHFTTTELKEFVAHAQEDNADLSTPKQSSAKQSKTNNKKQKKKDATVLEEEKGEQQDEINWRIKKHSLVENVLVGNWPMWQKKITESGKYTSRYQRSAGNKGVGGESPVHAIDVDNDSD